MPPLIVISYDDSDNDRDALALGRLFGDAGADLALAYVRHTPELDRERALAEERHAGELLDRGAAAIDRPDIARHVVLNASTGEGLRELAVRERAAMVVFGSEYRTAAGSVRPGVSAQRLLSGGPAAVALAPARFHDAPHPLRRIGSIADGVDLAPVETAETLATATGGEVVDARDGSLDLLVIGSRPEAELGRVMLSAVTEYVIDLSRCAVLVVPRGTPVRVSADAPATAEA
jgi:nucleotide-binding universal stress UspA family protein